MRILLIGYTVPDWLHVGISMQMLTHGMEAALRRLPVELQTIHAERRHDPGVLLPEADAVVVIDFYSPVIQRDLKTGWLREQTRAKQIVSLCECSFADADHSFLFDRTFYRDDGSCTYFPLPCLTEFMAVEPKTPKSVLLDYKPHFEPDMTEQIAGWVAPLAGEYSFSRIVIPDHVTHPYETRIPRTHYRGYLDQTARFEKYVVTHRETYGFSVIDMAARGTLILAPADCPHIPEGQRDFLRPCLIDDLVVQTFRTRDELLDLIRQPYQPPQTKAFTSYETMAWDIYRYLCSRM